MSANAELIAEARERYGADAVQCPYCDRWGNYDAVATFKAETIALANALEAAQADNAALLEIATAAVSACANDDWRNRWMAALDHDHSGDALLRELDALRAVAEAFRAYDLAVNGVLTEMQQEEWAGKVFENRWLAAASRIVRLPERDALAAWEAVRRG